MALIWIMYARYVLPFIQKSYIEDTSIIMYDPYMVRICSIYAPYMAVRELTRSGSWQWTVLSAVSKRTAEHIHLHDPWNWLPCIFKQHPEDQLRWHIKPIIHFPERLYIIETTTTSETFSGFLLFSNQKHVWLDIITNLHDLLRTCIFHNDGYAASFQKHYT